MKAKEILRQVTRMNATEQQGTVTCSDLREFIENTFTGAEKYQFNGMLKDDTDYFYSYDNSLAEVPDVIINANDCTIFLNDCTIFLYEIED